MKNRPTAALLAVPLAALLAACAPDMPPAEALRPVRTVELRYAGAGDVDRYTGTVRARHEVDEAFRVGGKVVRRLVDVGQTVREGDVLAVIDDTDYRLALDAAQQAVAAAASQAKQAESDRKRLAALRADGSVSEAEEERTRTAAQTTAAAAEAEARKLDLARNRLNYTVLRAARGGVVTAVRFEAGQVVAEGLPILSVAAEGEPEIVVDIPENHLAAFRKAKFQAALATAPDDRFDVVLRELAPQAAAQTRTYQARLKPAAGKRLPLGATATLVAERSTGETPVATVPTSAITQVGGKPAVWVVRRGAEGTANVVQMPVKVHGYRNDEVLLSGPQAGELVVTAGVQKMSPGLKVALPAAAAAVNEKVAAQ
jgi:RND family efflux transporter MFP subunit